MKQSKTTQKSNATESVVIKAPNMQRARFTLRGLVPYVQNRFSEKAINMMKAKQEAGSRANKSREKSPKDFALGYEQSQHVSTDGWKGIPAGAFRKAMISACRLVDFKMTLAKLSLFVEQDSFDAVDGTPLVRITKGESRYVEHFVRNETGVADIRPRAMWDPGWEAILTVRWDGDQFSAQDVVNLLSRVGLQVGVGEGRPDSRNSAGMGWGLFEVVS